MLLFAILIITFNVNTDLIYCQIVGVVYQEHKPVNLFSSKLMYTHKRYITGNKELLIIVLTLKHFRMILLGNKIKLYTEHKNFMHDSMENYFK